MSATVMQQDAAFSYELLLRKTSASELVQAKVSEDSVDSASTVEPRSSAASSAGSDNHVAFPSRDSVTVLRNVAVHGPHSDARMAEMIEETRRLSQRVFDEDCVLEVTKKSGWKLSLLVSEDLGTLCGFIIAKVIKGSLSIAKLAVPAEFRGSGFGRLIMEELMFSAKKQGGVYEVCLSSLSTAVTFYQRLGFKAFKNMKLGPDDDDLVEGQVYMEKKLCRRPRK